MEWLPALLDVAPQLSIAALLSWLLFRVWDRATSDRTSYEQGLQEAQARYESDMRLLREEIERLRRRIDELNRALDEERAARRAAQDAAWRGGES